MKAQVIKAIVDILQDAPNGLTAHQLIMYMKDPDHRRGLSLHAVPSLPGLNNFLGKDKRFVKVGYHREINTPWRVVVWGLSSDASRN